MLEWILPLGTLLYQPAVREYISTTLIPTLGKTMQTLIWKEVWKHIWEFVLDPFPRNLLMPSSTTTTDAATYDASSAMARNGDGGNNSDYIAKNDHDNSTNIATNDMQQTHQLLQQVEEECPSTSSLTGTESSPASLSSLLLPSLSWMWSYFHHLSSYLSFQFWHQKLHARIDKWTSSLLRKCMEQKVQSSVMNLLLSQRQKKQTK
jgi:hypothetical protein